MTPYVIIGILVLTIVGGLYFLVIKKRSESSNVDPEKAKVIEEKTTLAIQADVKIEENKMKIDALKKELMSNEKTPNSEKTPDLVSSTSDMTDEEIHAELKRRGEI